MTAIPRAHVPAFPLMIGLSVAVGRFIEALFWAILKVAGTVAGVAVLGVAGLVAVFVIGRRLLARR